MSTPPPNPPANPPPPKQQLTAAITRREDLTDDLFKVWLQPSEPFVFKPGQYCTIGAAGIERPYSIASAPAEPLLELFVEVVPPPDGQLTPILDRMGAGDTVSLRRRPKGLFLFKPNTHHHIMVSTVTGVAPYTSILRHWEQLPEWGEHAFHLLQGASHQDEFGYHDELAAFATRHPNVHYTPSVSRPQAPRNRNWNGRAGRVNEWAMDHIATLNLNPADTTIYACGHPLMIEDMRQRCQSINLPLQEERFWSPRDGG